MSALPTPLSFKSVPMKSRSALGSMIDWKDRAMASFDQESLPPPVRHWLLYCSRVEHSRAYDVHAADPYPGSRCGGDGAFAQTELEMRTPHRTRAIPSSICPVRSLYCGLTLHYKRVISAARSVHPISPYLLLPYPCLPFFTGRRLAKTCVTSCTYRKGGALVTSRFLS